MISAARQLTRVNVSFHFWRNREHSAFRLDRRTFSSLSEKKGILVDYLSHFRACGLAFLVQLTPLGFMLDFEVRSSLAVVAVDMPLPSQVGCMAENDVAVAAITSTTIRLCLMYGHIQQQTALFPLTALLTVMKRRNLY
jgi:hypothetical protein